MFKHMQQLPSEYLGSMQVLHLAVTDDYPKSFAIPPCYTLCSITCPCLHHLKIRSWINLHILGLCFFRDELWNSSPRMKLNHIFRFLSRLYYEFAALCCHPSPHLQEHLWMAIKVLGQTSSGIKTCCHAAVLLYGSRTCSSSEKAFSISGSSKT